MSNKIILMLLVVLVFIAGIFVPTAYRIIEYSSAVETNRAEAEEIARGGVYTIVERRADGDLCRNNKGKLILVLTRRADGVFERPPLGTTFRFERIDPDLSTWRERRLVPPIWCFLKAFITEGRPAIVRSAQRHSPPYGIRMEYRNCLINSRNYAAMAKNCEVMSYEQEPSSLFIRWYDNKKDLHLDEFQRINPKFDLAPGTIVGFKTTKPDLAYYLKTGTIPEFEDFIIPIIVKRPKPTPRPAPVRQLIDVHLVSAPRSAQSLPLRRGFFNILIQVCYDTEELLVNLKWRKHDRDNGF